MIAVVGCGGVFSQAQTNVAESVKINSRQIKKNQADATAKGIEAFNRGETDAARKQFEIALKSNPNDAAAHQFLGILDDAANDLKAAEIHFRAAARITSQSPSARNNYGAILLKLKRPVEAAREFEASLKLDAKQANALVNLAQIRFDENTPNALQSAFDLFERAAVLSDDAAIERSLVVIALRLKNKTAAVKHYLIYKAQLAELTNQADAKSRTELGGALYEAGLSDEAATELKAALAADASNTDAIALLGKVYLKQNDLKAAGILLETAVARNQATGEIYSLLAVVYEKLGHYENAIPAMRLAINAQPDSENYRFQYGLLLADANAPAAAVIRLDEALKTFPNSPRLWLARGIAQIKDNKSSDAAQSINRAIELDAKFAQAYAYLGLADVQRGEYAEAVKAFEKALAADPNLGVVHQLIADALLEQNNADNERIEAELKKAIALAPDYAPSKLTLGRLYVRTERWTEAAATLSEVVRRRPDAAEAYYQLGRVYTRLKMKKEAAEALAKFKELSESQKTKSDTDLRETVKRLADVRF